MAITFWIELVIVLACIFIGARFNGVGLGIWGGVGLFVISMVFGVTPTAPPVDVLLIILGVVTAAATMDAAGGIDWLVSIAERIIRANPKYITIIAPLVTWLFTFLAGTGHIVYPLQPVIYEVAMSAGIRPERPMAVATIASQQSITASPISAATAAMLGMFAAYNFTDFGLPQILMICVPSTLVGVIIAGFISMHLGRELADDPEFQARVKAGLVNLPKAGEKKTIKPTARRSAIVFLIFVAIAVASGLIPELRTLPGSDKPVGMATVLEIFMLVNAAAILVTCRPKVDDIVRTATMRAGLVAMIGIFGLAWLGDSFVAANKADLINTVGDIARAMPWTFAFVLFFVSVLLYSQAATARAVMPLGAALGIPCQTLIAMYPAVNGYFFIPTYGSLVAAIAFDGSGTTRIGKYVLNHSFMIPGLVATIIAVSTGLLITSILY
ncbi:anaerobic C4-dicarboxylate transporter family protein [Sutterella sp.]|uniref:anaerobic C4-dicarboxylate transporter family protein n=1 Tax=Sutterella sp. TaxID=1981025 RepID=UPI0026E086AD|nr:anaerobic C4-dicarboxylate transporter [Sutterella sp.]MDO5530878.1 anaerobic C4-dicarboxylate transporter [Sutterella sp.]